MPTGNKLVLKYRKALKGIIGRTLEPGDGLAEGLIHEAERRLKIKLPPALKDYYRIAGNLTLNTEHNQLYPPNKLRWLEKKLVFMEENQAVVFWGIDKEALPEEDPEVFQVANEEPFAWYSEELSLSDWLIKMWRWQRGLDSESSR